MTTDELRAAAEYCCEKDGYAYIAGPAADGDFIDKAKAVAAAWLAANPADDAEPVAEEWLRSIGGGDGVPMKGRYRMILTLHVAAGPMKAECRLDQGENSVLIPSPATRGHVRRLLAALGIEVKGA